MKRLAIINSDPMDCAYGGVAPIIKNMHEVLAEHFDLDYYYLPESWKKTGIPCRLLIMVYAFWNCQKIRKADFILSHIPEGSFAVSFFGRPYAHIYHGNSNPMEGSRYSFGKYFKWVFNLFFRRIARTASLRYTVGPVWDGVKKLYNPIVQNVTPMPIEDRNGFIFCGRLEQVKNIDRLIRIYSQMPEDVREGNPFVIVGTGTLEGELKSLSANLGIQDYVIFMGKVDNSEIQKIDSIRKLLLMSSSFEGFPTAIAEALSVGVPVVTTDVGDIGNVIKDGYNGRLLGATYSDKEYIDAVLSVLSDYSRYSMNALESSCVFDSRRITEDICRDILSVVE